MASRDLTYRIGVDAGDAVSGLRKLESAVRSTMRDVEEELDDSATAGDKFTASIDRVAAQMREEFASAAIAAEELQRALRAAGSELDVGDALSTLQRMGVSMDEVTQDADKFAASLRQLDEVRIAGVKDLDSVAPGLASKLDDVSKSADSSKGALANMIGNSAQDLGELGGIAGSTGVAVGQMAEYFADAAFSGEGLRSVLSNFGKVAGPIAGLALAFQLLSEAQQRVTAGSKRSADNVETLTDAFIGGDDAASAYAEALQETGEVSLDVARSQSGLQNVAGAINETFRGLVPQWRLLAEVVGAAGDEVEDITPLLNQAGIEVEDWARWVTEGTGDNEAWRRSLAATSLSAEEQAKVLETLSQHQADAAEAKRNAAEFEEFHGKAVEETTTNLEDEAEAAREAAEAHREQTIALTDASRALGDISSVFAEIGRRSDAISAMFDLGNAPLEAASATRDISEAIGELAETAEDVDVGAILAGNMDADAVLDALDGLRPQIQAKIADAFAAGGPEAASAVADDYVNQIVYALGGKLTADQVKELLGLTDLEATIEVALDESTAARVRSELDVLTGVAGATPLTASIALALDAGAITPEAAEVLVRQQLGQAGVALPTQAEPPSPESVAEAGRFVTEFAKGNPAMIPLEGDATPATETAEGFAKGELDPATIPLEGDTTPAEDERAGFVRETERTKPVVEVDADTKAAIGLMVYLKILAALLAPTVTVTADTTQARSDIRALGDMHPRVPVDAYLADYPTAGDIQRAIGRPRIPVDIVVGSSIRITGVRE